MTHKFIITNKDNTYKLKYTELLCTICNIKAFSDPLAQSNIGKIYLYEEQNNFNFDYSLQIMYAEEITCEEFIIKNIIE